MSFDAVESSTEHGRPVLLFKFARTGKTWYFTDADQDITFDGQAYTNVPAKVPAIVQSGDAKAEDVIITMPVTATICQYLNLITPSEPISVFIRKAHMIETASTGLFTAPVVGDAPIVWVGEISSIQRPSPRSMGLVCSTISLSMARGGLRLSWSRNCQHMLYAPFGCKVDKTGFATTVAALTVVNSITVSATEIDALPDGWFSGGFLEWNSEAGVLERTGIELHVGATLSLIGSSQGMATATNIKAYPGCARTATMCNDRFNNLLNYGGVNHLQGKSPFDGTPVF